MVLAYRPRDEREMAAAISQLVATATPVEIAGAGTKRRVGRHVEQRYAVETTGLTGLTLYEPTELVMAARAGTSIAEIETTLAERGQMLAFEPMDLGPATGGPSGLHTLGGVVAANISGPRRIASGGVRDHLLGVRAVNGRGEVFKSGGRVLKNVTGYDVGRALTGSWGTLAVLTEITVKVMPRPERTETLVIPGLTEEIAVEAMCAALGTPYEVSGTIHLTAALTARLELGLLAREGVPLTLLRLENFADSVPYRAGRLAEALKVYGAATTIGHDASLFLWTELRRLSVFAPAPDRPATHLWKLSTAPRSAGRLMAALRRNTSADAMLDASGGLIWLEVPASADAGGADIRRILASFGGHATLIRAEPEVRASVEVFQPMGTVTARLSAGLKAAFDPSGILNRGRMYAAF